MAAVDVPNFRARLAAFKTSAQATTPKGIKTCMKVMRGWKAFGKLPVGIWAQLGLVHPSSPGQEAGHTPGLLMSPDALYTFPGSKNVAEQYYIV